MTPLIAELRADLERLVPEYLDAKSTFVRCDGLVRSGALSQPSSGRTAAKRDKAARNCEWLATDIRTTSLALLALIASEVSDA